MCVVSHSELDIVASKSRSEISVLFAGYDAQIAKPSIVSGFLSVYRAAIVSLVTPARIGEVYSIRFTHFSAELFLKLFDDADPQLTGIFVCESAVWRLIREAVRHALFSLADLFSPKDIKQIYSFKKETAACINHFFDFSG